jgi:hypothetical protein
MIAEETAAVILQDIPFYGICLYPVIDRPDWDHLSPWHNAGLWDAAPGENEPREEFYTSPMQMRLLPAGTD